MGFLFSVVILWDCCDNSCDKGFWCLRAHGLLEVHPRAEQSGLDCALVGCWQIPRALGLQRYRARKHLQKSSRPTLVHIFTAILPTWNPAAGEVLHMPNTMEFLGSTTNRTYLQIMFSLQKICFTHSSVLHKTGNFVLRIFFIYWSSFHLKDMRSKHFKSRNKYRNFMLTHTEPTYQCIAVTV